MKINPETYETVRIHTPDFPHFVIEGYADEVELAVRSFGRLKEVGASTFDKAVYGAPERATGRNWQLGRLSVGLA
jgi:hypothetical protein